MTKSIEQRIFDIYETLSPSERQLADVLLEHQQNMASYTALELSAMANVSNATAARLVRKLGYKSVNDARRQVRTAQHWGSPLERLEETPDPNTAAASMTQMTHSDAANLKMTDENLNAADLARAVGILHSSRRVWVWGVRHGFGLAHLAKHYLSFALSDVQVIPSGSGLSDDFAAFRPGDALLVFAFRRRPTSLAALLAEARKIGLQIIMVADTSAARNTRDVDVVLRCWCNSPAVFTSLTAGVTVINYLSWALLEAVGQKGIERLQAMEHMLMVTDDIGSAKAPRSPKKGNGGARNGNPDERK
ncbi:RpiR family transcriptional regulator [Pseudaminobacter salicylatoxidans]|uniref:RpiR family transcriptional regulator n=1 Tax=Pseudaminobacter salicylatoxidans TaxID=93369 RepID=A0A316CA02_PSESE|nr:MurR/RpiR family transcriptional regulator [Pseudaminobacter salicylatoxidans]PWJ86328.1 RpiR family transcriptional regulator [Pseudaminobacter salicylatoxidans]